jgi:hypothetical protein
MFQRDFTRMSFLTDCATDQGSQQDREGTVPPTAPTPAPIAVSFSRVVISPQPTKPSSTAAATALAAILCVVFMATPFCRIQIRKIHS